MKFRLALVLISLSLSLAVPADRLSDNCRDAWQPSFAPANFPSGPGVNIHFTDPQPGELKMLAEAGLRWVRMDFKWDATEKERGRYDFSSYDHLTSALDQYKLRAIFILDYGNPLYDNGAPPRSEEARQAFTRWAVAAARHFAARGIIWEIYNEANIAQFWPPKPNVSEYIALSLSVGRAFRAAVPSEKLIGPATSLIDLPFLEACFKAGLLEYWSAVSVHPYRHSDPESVANEYCQLRKLIDRYKSGVPIISGEWGYSDVWPGMSEQKQAEMLARAALTNAANGIPLSIWYDWRDDGVDAKEPEHHFGLVRNAYHSGRDPVYDPKPAYYAVKTVLAFINGYVFEKRINVGSDLDFVLAFRKGNTVRIAAWTSESKAHLVTVPMAGQIQLTAIGGGTRKVVSSTSSGVVIEVSIAPVYVDRQ